MSIFNIPNEVLFELMDGDIDDLEAEADAEYSSGRRTMAMFPSHRQHFANQLKQPSAITCPDCGSPNVRWVKTANGDRLIYASGMLRGKLHACPEE